MSLKSLHDLLNSLQPPQRSLEQKRFQQVLDAWSQVVGAVVAVQTQPLAIQRDVLRVATASAAWAQNLVFERRRILEKLNARVSQPLEDIRFSTAQWQDREQLSAVRLDQQAQVWRDHPSRLPIDTSSKLPLPTAPIADATDPVQVFQVWATTMRAQMQALPTCSRCQCPTPPGELERWGVCSVCAAKQWQGKA